MVYRLTTLTTMQKYEVIVARTSYASKTFEVIATSYEEAKDLAINQAYDEVFQDHDAQYEAQFCYTIPETKVS